MSGRKFIKYTSWILMNLAFIAWLIIFLTRVSGKLQSWSWYRIFSPLYITFFLGLFFVTSSSMKSRNLEYFVWSLMSCCSLGIFSIMVSVKLESPSNPNVNLIYVLIPLWVFLGLSMLLRLDDDKRSTDRGNIKHYKSRGLKKTINVFYPSAIVYFGIYTILELISQTLYQLSWSIKFIPFFIFIGTTIMVLLTNIGKPGWQMFIPGLISCFLILLYLYFMEKIGHIAVSFIPIYILIPIQFVFGFFV